MSVLGTSNGNPHWYGYTKWEYMGNSIWRIGIKLGLKINCTLVLQYHLLSLYCFRLLFFFFLLFAFMFSKWQLDCWIWKFKKRLSTTCDVYIIHFPRTERDSVAIFASWKRFKERGMMLLYFVPHILHSGLGLLKFGWIWGWLAYKVQSRLLRTEAVSRVWQPLCSLTC